MGDMINIPRREENKMDKDIEFGEKIYTAMFSGVFLDFLDMLKMYVEPLLEEKYKDEKSKIKIMNDKYIEMGRKKTHIQKKRLKNEILNLKTEGEKIQFIKACFSELDLQLCKILKLSLKETVDFEDAQNYIKETIEEKQKEIVEELKK